MSRLDSFIRRMTAQRACLDLAAGLIAGRPGKVLELGLGNGRTYDHLRERLPEREIFVFDRQVAAHPDSTPDPQYLILGDIAETLPRAAATLGADAVLAHVDIGTGDHDRNRQIAALLARLLPPLLADGAIVLADQEIPAPHWRPIDLPDAVRPGRYFMYRVAAPGRRA